VWMSSRLGIAPRAQAAARVHRVLNRATLQVKRIV
jgi:hypothetical protein